MLKLREELGNVKFKQLYNSVVDIKNKSTRDGAIWGDFYETKHTTSSGWVTNHPISSSNCADLNILSEDIRESMRDKYFLITHNTNNPILEDVVFSHGASIGCVKTRMLNSMGVVLFKDKLIIDFSTQFLFRLKRIDVLEMSITSQKRGIILEKLVGIKMYSEEIQKEHKSFLVDNSGVTFKQMEDFFKNFSHTEKDV